MIDTFTGYIEAQIANPNTKYIVKNEHGKEYLEAIPKGSLKWMSYQVNEASRAQASLDLAITLESWRQKELQAFNAKYPIRVVDRDGDVSYTNAKGEVKKRGWLELGGQYLTYDAKNITNFPTNTDSIARFSATDRFKIVTGLDLGYQDGSPEWQRLHKIETMLNFVENGYHTRSIARGLPVQQQFLLENNQAITNARKHLALKHMVVLQADTLLVDHVGRYDAEAVKAVVNARQRNYVRRQSDIDVVDKVKNNSFASDRALKEEDSEEGFTEIKVSQLNLKPKRVETDEGFVDIAPPSPTWATDDGVGVLVENTKVRFSVGADSVDGEEEVKTVVTPQPVPEPARPTIDPQALQQATIVQIVANQLQWLNPEATDSFVKGVAKMIFPITPQEKAQILAEMRELALEHPDIKLERVMDEFDAWIHPYGILTPAYEAHLTPANILKVGTRIKEGVENGQASEVAKIFMERGETSGVDIARTAEVALDLFINSQRLYDIKSLRKHHE